MSDVNSNAPLSSSFRYRNVLEKGKPKHDKNDLFSIRHPAMELSRRAKIFSPFDALKGFSDELSMAQAEADGAFPDVTDVTEEDPPETYKTYKFEEYP